MNIRPLAATERDAAVDLWGTAGLTRPWNDPASDFERAIANHSSTVLGAFDGYELAGTVMVGDDGHRGWVYYLAVRETHQRSGLGRALMTADEEWLRGHGAVKVNLMVRESNQVALGFYERLGYQDDGVAVLSRWLIDPSSGNTDSDDQANR